MDINKFNHVSNYYEQMHGKNGRLTLFFLCFRAALTITSIHALTISLRMDFGSPLLDTRRYLQIHDESKRT